MRKYVHGKYVTMKGLPEGNDWTVQKRVISNEPESSPIFTNFYTFTIFTTFTTLTIFTNFAKLLVKLVKAVTMVKLVKGVKMANLVKIGEIGENWWKIRFVGYVWQKRTYSFNRRQPIPLQNISDRNQDTSKWHLDFSNCGHPVHPELLDFNT